MYTSTLHTGSLQKRLFFLSAGALLMMAICVVGAVSLPLLESWKHLEEGNLLHQTQAKARLAGEWLRQRRHMARQLAESGGMREEQEALRTGGKSAEEVLPGILHAIDATLSKNAEVLAVGRLDAWGRVLAAGGAGLPERELRSLPANARDVRISLPVELDGRRCLLFSVPVRNQKDAYLGTDVIAYGLDPLVALLDGNNVFLGAAAGNAAVWIAGGQEFPGDESVIDGVLHRALRGDTGVLPQRRTVLAFAPVPDSPWGLIVRVPLSTLYEPVWGNLYAMFGYVALIYALCLAGFLPLSHTLANAILRRTRELEMAITAKVGELQEELSARIKAEHALEESREALECRVRSRTYSLAEANMALLKEQERRKRLSRELLNLLEDVRSTISRDLHDHTGQLLTTLRLSLEAAHGELGTDAAGCAERLRAAGETVKVIQRALKDIARGLRPPSLDYLGLVSSLEALLSEYRQAGLRVFFFHKDIPGALGKELSLALYRIAQEALTNVLRHAAACNVHVSFTLQHGMLTLAIEDDGRGFDVGLVLRPRGPRDNMGLMLIRERVDLLGGDCMIDSTPGRGTHIIVQIPNPEGNA